ncbi:MAG: polysaccharide deacetylase family protein [Candidatus Parabeggiatoa sp.]|nr:polysaccharide deacetylase family protein [Candidatus Parabeggiatoa sp.]
MNILTFDIEEWFHILDNPFTADETKWNRFESRIHNNVDNLLDLLSSKNKKATFFILGWIAKKYPEIVKKIDALGYEIGTHSNNHRLLYQQSRQEIVNDLRSSINRLEDITGKSVYAYRAPGFSIMKENTWVFEILIEHEIQIDCSIFPTTRAHGGFKEFSLDKPCLIEINGQTIKEFPLNLFHFGILNIVFSGGGYFRVLPYFLIKDLIKRSKYVMTYFHPRDFDPQQPMIKELSLNRKLKSYYGLSNALQKLEKLVDDFEFLDLNSADKLIDWNTTKVLKLDDNFFIK